MLELQITAKRVRESAGVMGRTLRLPALAAVEQVIAWIAKSSYHAPHDEVAKLRFAGTGEWFLQTDEFQAWSASSGGKLWVTAMRTFFTYHTQAFLTRIQLEQGKQFSRE